MSLGTSLNRTIKEQIRDKIDALSSVAKVYTFPKFPIEQDPTVFVLYGSLEGEFWSNRDNERTYAYRVLVIYNIGQDTPGETEEREQHAHEAIGQTVEEVINALDTDFELGQFNADVVYLDAVDVVYGEIEAQDGMAVVGDLTIRVHTLYNVGA